MRLNKYIASAAIAVMSLTCTGCYDLDRYPDSKVSSGTFFKTEEHAKQAMMAVYAIMRANSTFGYYYAYDTLGGISYGYDTAGFEHFCTGKMTATEGFVSTKWQKLYEGIARANNLIQNVGSCDMDDDIKERYVAEARFMRGLYYFALCDFFGGVPLYDESTIVGIEYENMLKERASLEETREFILADFKAAEALPVEWDEADKGRATRGAAIALCGKALLYFGRYAEANKCFDEIYGEYQLYPNYADLFTPKGDDSSEMIFAIQCVGGIGQEAGLPFGTKIGTRSAFGFGTSNVQGSTRTVNMYEWADGRPFDWNEWSGNKKIRDIVCSTLNSSLTAVTSYTSWRSKFLEMYSQRDPRMAATYILPYTYFDGWMENAPITVEYVIPKSGTIGGNRAHNFLAVTKANYVYPYRKFVPTGNMNGEINSGDNTPINFPIIRYADVLLMKAECLNELGDQPGAVALINEVRARPSVNMPAINSGPAYLKATTYEEVFERIKHERIVELACEGHSYSDRKRWGTLLELDGIKEYKLNSGTALHTRKVQERDYLWPIPTTEIDRNPSLKQNPLW